MKKMVSAFFKILNLIIFTIISIIVIVSINLSTFIAFSDIIDSGLIFVLVLVFENMLLMSLVSILRKIIVEHFDQIQKKIKEAE